MRKMSTLDRVLLFATDLLAAYQIVTGAGAKGDILVGLAYTIAFGVLLVAGLLLIIFGFDVLESSLVVITATVIPLSISLGLILEYVPALGTAYLVFAICGVIAVATTQLRGPGKLATVVLAVTHSLAGLLIFGIPIASSLRGTASIGFLWVSVGGAFIGIGGMLFSFLRMGRPMLSKKLVFALLSPLLLLMSVTFVIGLTIR